MTPTNVHQEIGGVDGSGEEEDPYINEQGDYDEYGNWWNSDGDFYPAESNVTGEANEVTRGKAKAPGPNVTGAAAGATSTVVTYPLDLLRARRSTGKVVVTTSAV